DRTLAPELRRKDPRVRRPALADKGKDVRGESGRHKAAVRPTLIKSRVQEFADMTWHEAVGVQIVLFRGERGITSLQIADPIFRDAMAKNQILSASRRSNGIRLDELDLRYRARKRAWRMQCHVRGLSAQLLQRQSRRHGLHRRDRVRFGLVIRHD